MIMREPSSSEKVLDYCVAREGGQSTAVHSVVWSRRFDKAVTLCGQSIPEGSKKMKGAKPTCRQCAKVAARRAEEERVRVEGGRFHKHGTVWS